MIFSGLDASDRCNFCYRVTDFANEDSGYETDHVISTMGIRLNDYPLRTGSPVHEVAIRNCFVVQRICGFGSGSGSGFGSGSGSGFESVLLSERKKTRLDTHSGFSPRTAFVAAASVSSVTIGKCKSLS